MSGCALSVGARATARAFYSSFYSCNRHYISLALSHGMVAALQHYSALQLQHYSALQPTAATPPLRLRLAAVASAFFFRAS